MAYTNHGWHIPGTSDAQLPLFRARCGGIEHCPECKAEAEKADTSPCIYSSEVVPQIPSASLSDEDLRLECLALAVELKARFTHIDRTTSTIEIAKRFVEYVRPTDA